MCTVLLWYNLPIHGFPFLSQVYKGFLEELHFHGVLKIADVDKIFANLSELCEVCYIVCVS